MYGLCWSHCRDVYGTDWFGKWKNVHNAAASVKVLKSKSFALEFTSFSLDKVSALNCAQNCFPSLSILCAFRRALSFSSIDLLLHLLSGTRLRNVPHGYDDDYLIMFMYFQVHPLHDHSYFAWTWYWKYHWWLSLFRPWTNMCMSAYWGQAEPRARTKLATWSFPNLVRSGPGSSPFGIFEPFS